MMQADADRRARQRQPNRKLFARKRMGHGQVGRRESVCTVGTCLELMKDESWRNVRGGR